MICHHVFLMATKISTYEIRIRNSDLWIRKKYFRNTGLPTLQVAYEPFSIRISYLLRSEIPYDAILRDGLSDSDPSFEPQSSVADPKQKFRIRIRHEVSFGFGSGFESGSKSGFESGFESRDPNHGFGSRSETDQNFFYLF
jgi:hypothetical protein